MKKLISLLMMLLLVMTCAFALAEDNAGAEPTATPVPADVAAETAEPAEPTEEDEIAKLQAEIETLKARLDELTDEDEELATYGTNYHPDNLIVDGLLVTVVGLAGVFLVLILFFLTIKFMHKMLK